MTEQTDEQIAIAVQKGDAQAFGLLVERFEPKLLRYARKFLFDYEDGKDMVQEVFIKAYTNIQSFDPDTLFPHPTAPTQADDELKKAEIKEMVEKCLQKLDPKYREPLVLYYFEDMDYRQISEIMRIPVSTAAIRLKRGRASLQKIYESLNLKS